MDDPPCISRRLSVNGARFSMITKLPRWVWCGAWILAFVAGIINVVGLLGFEHQGVTHLTGTVSQASVAIVEYRESRIAHLTAVILSFFAGTVMSGVIVQDFLSGQPRRL